MYVNFFLVMAVLNTAISDFHCFFPSQFELIYPFNLILAWPVGLFKVLDQ